MQFLHTTWDDIQRLCEVLADKIKVGYQPDIIVAIGRGGFPPARILCDLLDITALASMRIEYYKSINERKKRPIILYPLNADVRKMRVLIVDDVADTGRSLVKARDHVLEKGATVVKMATLHYKPWSVVEPDFYAEVTNAWVVYVWETRETVEQLVSKFRSNGKNSEEVKKQLLKLGFKENDLKDL